MIKLSKKQLKEYAKNEEAYYFTGNVYSYENIIHYLDLITYYTRDGKKDNLKEYKDQIVKNCNINYFNSLKDIIENIEKIRHDSYSIKQIAYSCGVYGNSGQLHQLQLFYKDQVVGSYYLYY